MSWLDLADVDWNGGDLWEHHRAYIRSQIASPRQLARWQAGGRSRQLSDFFGPEAAEAFDDQLREAVGDFDGYVAGPRTRPGSGLVHQRVSVCW